MSVASVHHVSYYSNLGMISEKACLRFDSDLIIHKMVLAMVVLLRAKKNESSGASGGGDDDVQMRIEFQLR